MQTAMPSELDAGSDAILNVLRRGGSYTIAEIAAQSGLPARSVTGHVRRLREIGEVAQASQYRYRFIRLASPIEAHAIAPQAERTCSDIPRDIRFARSCYGHLAGWLGVTLTRALLEQGLLALTDDVFQVTLDGQAWLGRLDIHLPERRPAPRRFARPCLDWTEKRPHLAGVVGEALLSHYIARGWLERWRPERTLTLTGAGETALQSELGIRLR